ncbi:MAG: Arc family DNA-binding protein [Anaerolineales bacterium]|nr:Arc family DNA-binding protein [Anaerolineales bacterium]
MPAMTLKNIPLDLYQRLKQLAEANRRSLNSQVLICLEQAVSSQPLDPDLLLARARQLREQTAAYQISDEDFNQAKSAGRP